MSDKGIGIIYRGEIDHYYCLRMKTTLSFENICNQISENIRRITSASHIKDKVKVALEESGERGIKVFSNLDMVQEFAFELSNSIRSCIVNKQIYGIKYIESQRCFVLPPFKVKLINDEDVWIGSRLHVFENKMIIIRLSLPLINVHIDALKKNNYDEYIKDINNVYNVPEYSSENKILAIRDAYYNSILRLDNSTLLYDNRVLRNVILGSFEGQPANMELFESNLEEDIYKIVMAPISERPSKNYKKEAHEYIEENSYKMNDVIYIASSMGNCLSFLGTDYTRDLIWAKGLTNVEDEEKAILETADSVITGLRDNVEFALIILVLKRMSAKYLYEGRKYTKRSIYKIQEEYNRDVIFISELQEGCYGSARDQLNKFEQMMPYFLNTVLLREKTEAYDKIVTTQKAKNEQLVQLFIAIGGFALTVLFGFPTIHETISLLKTLFFAGVEIPILLISSIAWGVTLLGTAIFLVVSIIKRIRAGKI